MSVIDYVVSSQNICKNVVSMNIHEDKSVSLGSDHNIITVKVKETPSDIVRSNRKKFVHFAIKVPNFAHV